MFTVVGRSAVRTESKEGTDSTTDRDDLASDRPDAGQDNRENAGRGKGAFKSPRRAGWCR